MAYSRLALSSGAMRHYLRAIGDVKSRSLREVDLLGDHPSRKHLQASSLPSSDDKVAMLSVQQVDRLESFISRVVQQFFRGALTFGVLKRVYLPSVHALDVAIEGQERRVVRMLNLEHPSRKSLAAGTAST